MFSPIEFHIALIISGVFSIDMYEPMGSYRVYYIFSSEVGGFSVETTKVAVVIYAGDEYDYSEKSELLDNEEWYSIGVASMYLVDDPSITIPAQFICYYPTNDHDAYNHVLSVGFDFYNSLYGFSTIYVISVMSDQEYFEDNKLWYPGKK